jgi:hypothetical protein
MNCETVSERKERLDCTLFAGGVSLELELNLPVEKSYLQMITDRDRIRVRFEKTRGEITEFVVQYETQLGDK